MSGPTNDTRLECVREICGELAVGINKARMVLHVHGDEEYVPDLVADALGRLGWLAERAAVLAGSPVSVAVGDADDWMMPHAAMCKAITIEADAAAVAQQGGAA